MPNDTPKPTRSHRSAAGRGTHDLVVLALLGFGLAGCQTMGPQSSTSLVSVEAPAPEEDWRTIAQPADLARLEALPASWRARLGAAPPTTATDPGTALPRSFLPPGDYLCRSVRVGAQPAPSRRVRSRGSRAPVRAAAAVQQPHNCHVGVERVILSFTQQNGPRRPGGFLYPDGDQRMIFIGADATGDDALPPPYGANPERDSIGIVERIGSFRYRLVLAPRGPTGPMEILELTPAPTAGRPS